MGAAIGGAGAGLVGGLLGSQKTSGANPGNMLLPSGPDGAGIQQDIQSSAIMPLLSQNRWAGVNDPSQSTQIADNQITSSPLMSQAFGQGGLLNQTGNQISDLMNSGYQLKPEDQTAYGQASGQIAQQFGQNDQSLAQALSNRGLSNSGAAGAAFSNSFGNKNEQLAQLQTQIAQNRMQMNQNMLNSARSFFGQLQGQGINAQQNQQSLNRSGQQADFNQDMHRQQAAQGYIQGEQGQQNNATAMERETQGSTTLSNAFNGMAGGAMTGSMFGGGGAGMPSTMATNQPGNVQRLPADNSNIFAQA